MGFETPPVLVAGGGSADVGIILWSCSGNIGLFDAMVSYIFEMKIFDVWGKWEFVAAFADPQRYITLMGRGGTMHVSPICRTLSLGMRHQLPVMHDRK